MLLEKLNENDIVTVKLKTGEELLAKYVAGDSATSLKLKTVMTLVSSPDGKGFALAPYLFTVDKNAELTFKSDNIMTVSKTEAKWASGFLQSTTSIKLATQNDMPDVNQLINSINQKDK